MLVAHARRTPKTALVLSQRATSLAFPTLLVLACGGNGDRGATYTVRDSAGIEIVENLSPAWMDGEAWQVDPDPVFDLSGQDVDELFRVGSPWVLPDGHLVLFSGGNCEVRFYDENGELVGSSGRCGRGPGEYLQSAWIWPWRGDSLLIFDWDLRRITILDGDGNVGRTALVPSDSDMPRPRVLGPLADGTLVLSGLRDRSPRSPGVVEASQLSLGLIRDLDDPVRLVGVYPGRIYEHREYRGSVGVNALAFSGSTKFAVGQDRLFVGFPDRYEIQVHRSDGTLECIVRRPFQPVQVTQDDIDWLMERRLGEVEGAENQRLVRQAYRDLRHADVMPGFGTPIWSGGREEGGPDMLADAAGNLWVFDYYRPGEYRNHWTVFSPDGVWLGTVALPEHLTPSQIGTDFLIGTWTDELGFVHVRRHRLIKP